VELVNGSSWLKFVADLSAQASRARTLFMRACLQRALFYLMLTLSLKQCEAYKAHSWLFCLFCFMRLQLVVGTNTAALFEVMLPTWHGSTGLRIMSLLHFVMHFGCLHVVDLKTVLDGHGQYAGVKTMSFFCCCLLSCLCSKFAMTCRDMLRSSYWWLSKSCC